MGRVLSICWVAFRQLFVLAIFAILLLAFSSGFERIVLALLGMIYAALTGAMLRQEYRQWEGRLLQAKQFLHLAKATTANDEEIKPFEESLKDELLKFQQKQWEFGVAFGGGWLVWLIGALALLQVLFQL